MSYSTLPEKISDLPIANTMARVPVIKPKKGERKTKDEEVPHYRHYTREMWQARYYLHPESAFGMVEIIHGGGAMMDASGHVAMINAMEMIDHWIVTGYKPRVTEVKCLADYSPAARFNVANQAAAGKATKPFIV